MSFPAKPHETIIYEAFANRIVGGFGGYGGVSGRLYVTDQRLIHRRPRFLTLFDHTEILLADIIEISRVRKGFIRNFVAVTATDGHVTTFQVFSPVELLSAVERYAPGLHTG